VALLVTSLCKLLPTSLLVVTRPSQDEMANRFRAGASGRFVPMGPPIECTRPTCRGSIPRDVLQHKLSNGLRPTCLVCQKLGSTRYYRLPPGADKPSFAEMQRAREANAAKFNNGGNAPWNKKQNLSHAPIKGEGNQQTLQKKVASLEKALEEAQRASAPPGGEDADNTQHDKGMPKEVQIQFKDINKQKSTLLGFTLQQKAAAFVNEAAYEKCVDDLHKQRTEILAINRSKMPIKVHHTKCSKYVENLTAELDSVKKEQSDMLLKWQMLEEQIGKKQQHLNDKMAELADLAEKAKQEDAAIPMESTQTQQHQRPQELQPVLVDEEQVIFKAIVSAFGKTNIKDILDAEGANEYDLKILESVWSKVGAAVLPAGGCIQSAGTSTAGGSLAMASSAGLESVTNIPPTGPMAVDGEALDKEWEAYLHNNQNLLEGGPEQIQTAKKAWQSINKAKTARTRSRSPRTGA
jgi:uncharacterized protein YoxC